MNLAKKIYRILSPKHQILYPEYHVDFKPRYPAPGTPHKGLYKIIDGQRANYAEHLTKMTSPDILPGILSMCDHGTSYSPVWVNKYFPVLDMMTLYGMLKIYNPESYIEVGSGNSTMVAVTAKTQEKLRTKLTSIDPYPRADIDSIVDEVIREPFEETNLDKIMALKENDILFIDNSHRMLPNSDSTAFYLDVLPYLNKGVIVHIHDIFLPYDYMQDMCDRFYSEQYGLAIFLIANPERYKILLNNYFVFHDKELAKLTEPMWSIPQTADVIKHGVSIWLQIS